MIWVCRMRPGSLFDRLVDKTKRKRKRKRREEGVILLAGKKKEIKRERVMIKRKERRLY